MTARGWRDKAACIGEDPNLWADDDPDSPTTQKAIRICGGCPVQAECATLRDGLISDGWAPFGVFAGEWHSGLDADFPQIWEGERERLLAEVQSLLDF